MVCLTANKLIPIISSPTTNKDASLSLSILSSRHTIYSQKSSLLIYKDMLSFINKPTPFINSFHFWKRPLMRNSLFSRFFRVSLFFVFSVFLSVLLVGFSFIKARRGVLFSFLSRYGMSNFLMSMFPSWSSINVFRRGRILAR